MRAEVASVLATLLAESTRVPTLELDRIGEVIGTMRIDPTEIEALLDALEAEGRTLVFPSGAQGVAILKQVIPASRALAKALGHTPSIDEIAQKSGVSAAEVRRALLLAKVMSRGSK